MVYEKISMQCSNGDLVVNFSYNSYFTLSLQIGHQHIQIYRYRILNHHHFPV